MPAAPDAVEWAKAGAADGEEFISADGRMYRCLVSVSGMPRLRRVIRKGEVPRSVSVSGERAVARIERISEFQSRLIEARTLARETELDADALLRIIAVTVHSIVARMLTGDLVPTTNSEANRTLETLTKVTQAWQVTTAELAAHIVAESHQDSRERYAKMLELVEKQNAE